MGCARCRDTGALRVYDTDIECDCSAAAHVRSLTQIAVHERSCVAIEAVAHFDVRQVDRPRSKDRP